MKIGVGLVTYNNDIYEIERYIKSFQNATKYSDADTILFYIDNGKESTVNKIYPEAIRISSQGNIGYTKAINILIKHAFDQHQVDAFICANGDGAFHHNAINSFVEQNYYDKGLSLLEGLQFPQEHPKPYNPIDLTTDWASGCCLFISRQIYQAIGLLDENFFMYLEDVDYSWRARLSGFNVKTCPHAIYAHAAMYRPPSRNTNKFFLESGVYLATKWGNESFANRCRDQLISDNHYKTVKDMPAIDHKFIISDKGKNISNFNFNFNFSKARW